MNTEEKFDVLSYLYDSLDQYADETLKRAMRFFLFQEGPDAYECYWRINRELYTRKINSFELAA